MGADHEARPAVAEITHGLLFACRLGVHVDDNRICVPAKLARGQFVIDRGKRMVEWIHKDAAHGVDHERVAAVLGWNERGAAAWSPRWIVDRTNEFRCSLDEDQRFFLFPGVIAERDGVGAGFEQLFIDGFGNAEAAGRVLAVDDNEIELPLANERWQPRGNDVSATTPDDIADK